MQNKISEQPVEAFAPEKQTGKLTEKTRPLRSAQNPTRPMRAGKAAAERAEREWRLGEYYVAQGTEALAGGGQAFIYPCRKDGATEQYAAKIYDTAKMRSHGPDPEKLKSEINDKISLLSCKTVVRILKHGFTDNGRYYMVVMRKYRKVPEDFLNFEIHGGESGYGTDFCNAVFDMFEALKVIHAQGILHCDIKPENIMADGKRLVLIDFGASAMREGRFGDGQSIPAGCVTLGYMAPEMAGRESPNVSESTDIYAMGLTLTKMVAGVFPKNLDDRDPYVKRNRDGGALLYGNIRLPKGLPPYMVRLFEGLLYEGNSAEEADLNRWGNSDVAKWLKLAGRGDTKAAAALPVGHGPLSRAGSGQLSQSVQRETAEDRATIHIPYSSRTENFSTEEDMLKVFRRNWQETVSMMADRDEESGLPGYFRGERGWNNVHANLQSVRKLMWDHEAEGEDIFFERIMMVYLPERVKKSQLWYRGLCFETREEFGSRLFSVLTAWKNASGGAYTWKKGRNDSLNLFLQMFASGRVSRFLAQPGVTWQPSGEEKERIGRIEDFAKRNREPAETVKRAGPVEDLYMLAWSMQGRPCLQFDGRIFDNYSDFLKYVGAGEDCGAVREKMKAVKDRLMTPDKKWRVDFHAWLRTVPGVKQPPEAGLREDI